MDVNHEHSWNLHQSKRGNLPKSDEAFEKKMAEWHGRDWMTWLFDNLSFPFTVVARKTTTMLTFRRVRLERRFDWGINSTLLGSKKKLTGTGFAA